MFSLYAFSSTLNYGTAAACQGATLERTFPSQTPAIYGLSQYSSVAGAYTVVYITGDNFVYGSTPRGGTNTVVYLTPTGGGTRTIVPTSFASSSNVSFVMPTNLAAGTYTLVVAVKSTVSGGNGTGMLAATTILFSNSETYTLT